MSENKGKDNYIEKKSVLNKALSILFSFLLAFALFAIAVTVVGRIALSETYTFNSLPADYFSELKKDTEAEMADYTIPTGIDTSVVEDLLDESSIEKDVKAYIDSTFKIRQYTIDTSAMETGLRERVLAFLVQQGAPTEPVNTEESEEELDLASVEAYNAAVEETHNAVDEYVSDIMEIYRKSIKISALDYLVKIGSDYRKYFPYILTIEILVSILSMFICLKLHRLPHRGLRYLVYSFSAAFLMTFVLPFVMMVNGFYKRLNITPEYFKNFISAYISGAITRMLLFGLLWLLIAVLLVLLVAVLRKKHLRSSVHNRRDHHRKDNGSKSEEDNEEDAESEEDNAEDAESEEDNAEDVQSEEVSEE